MQNKLQKKDDLNQFCILLHKNSKNPGRLEKSEKAFIENTLEKIMTFHGDPEYGAFCTDEADKGIVEGCQRQICAFIGNFPEGYTSNQFRLSVSKGQPLQLEVSLPCQSLDEATMTDFKIAKCLRNTKNIYGHFFLKKTDILNPVKNSFLLFKERILKRLQAPGVVGMLFGMSTSAENQEHTDHAVGVFLEKDLFGKNQFVFYDPNAGTTIVCKDIEAVLWNEIAPYHQEERCSPGSVIVISAQDSLDPETTKKTICGVRQWWNNLEEESDELEKFLAEQISCSKSEKELDQ
ncbi:MAG: hypothetical protein BGO07_00300 [Alphaproteobacteria bacterium 40-19]|nr:MAG: hypothetical protein BGO07_00300 [Alphaproteobacteria bacterium 40-19]